MFRIFSFFCDGCETAHDITLQYPQGEDPPRTIREMCPMTDAIVTMARMPSRTQKYLADRPFSPQMSGGSFDTTGHKKTSIPMPHIPDGATLSESAEVFSTPEWKAWKAEQKAVTKENKAKQARTAAIKRGDNIDIRHHKLPGDPDVMT